MTPKQFFLLPTSIALILALSGAFSRQPSASASPVAIVAPLLVNPSALEVLDCAIAALSPQRLEWIDAKVWQMVKCDDFTYQARGRFVRAPGDRGRYDLNVQVGSTLAEVRTICDGESLRKTVRVAGQSEEPQRLWLPTLDETHTTATAVAQARARLLEENFAAGPEIALNAVRQALQSAKVNRETWRGFDVFVIVGDSQSSRQERTTTGYVAQRCRVYIDAMTGWPHRFEWWGTAVSGGAMELISQTEYREPVLNQPFSPDRCTAEFTVNESN